jgi:DNA-binding response OmpR family regulator
LTIRFGPFTLDLDTRQLTREHREIHLTPKTFDLLVTLASDRPKVLSKAALQERPWPFGRREASLSTSRNITSCPSVRH